MNDGWEGWTSEEAHCLRECRDIFNRKSGNLWRPDSGTNLMIHFKGKPVGAYCFRDFPCGADMPRAKEFGVVPQSLEIRFIQIAPQYYHKLDLLSLLPQIYNNLANPAVYWRGRIGLTALVCHAFQVCLCERWLELVNVRIGDYCWHGLIMRRADWLEKFNASA